MTGLSVLMILGTIAYDGESPRPAVDIDDSKLVKTDVGYDADSKELWLHWCQNTGRVEGPALEREQLKTIRDSRSNEALYSEEDLFKERVSTYRSLRERLRVNIQLQIAGIIIAFLVLTRTSERASLFGVDIPIVTLHVVLPVALLYLWLAFGFLLDDLIEGRLRILRTFADPPTDKNILFHPAALLYDSSIIDGWFITFVDTDHWRLSGIDGSLSGPAGGFTAIVLGLLVTGSHVSILSVALAGFDRFPGTVSSKVLKAAALGTLVFILVASHLQFAYADNRNWLQLMVLALVPTLTAIIHWQTIHIDAKRIGKQLRASPGDSEIHFGTEAFRLAKDAEKTQVHLIGDSLSTSFSLQSLPKTALAFHFARIPNWFEGGHASIRPLQELVGDEMPLLLTNHSTPMASHQPEDRSYVGSLLLGVKDAQTQALDAARNFTGPGIIAFWIGHNAVDWRLTCKRKDIAEDDFDAALGWADRSARQLFEIIEGVHTNLASRQERCTVVVFGLINFESFFEARRAAEVIRRADPKRYPHTEDAYRSFRSMEGEDNRRGMIEYAKRFNATLEQLLHKLTDAQGIRVVYSEAMAEVQLEEAVTLSENDAWHPSPKGHARLAANALPVLARELLRLRNRPRADERAG